MTSFCCCIDLDYVIRRGGAAQMAGHIRLPRAAAWATEAELIAHATILQAKGLEVMPSCGNHDARGYCRGHEKEDA